MPILHWATDITLGLMGGNAVLFVYIDYQRREMERRAGRREQQPVFWLAHLIKIKCVCLLLDTDPSVLYPYLLNPWSHPM